MRKSRPPSLARARRRIDAIDARMLALLNERAALALTAGETKRALGLPLRSLAREREVLERVAKENQGPLSEAAVKRVFRTVMSACLQLERARGH